MVPFWGPYYNTGPNTGPNLGDPKRDHNFDNSPCPVLRSKGLVYGVTGNAAFSLFQILIWDLGNDYGCYVMGVKICRTANGGWS